MQDLPKLLGLLLKTIVVLLCIVLLLVVVYLKDTKDDPPENLPRLPKWQNHIVMVDAETNGETNRTITTGAKAL